MSEETPIHYKETRYGFEYGAAKVKRIFNREGQVCITLKTEREVIDIRVTKTGMIRTSHRWVNDLPSNCFSAHRKLRPKTKKKKG